MSNKILDFKRFVYEDNISVDFYHDCYRRETVIFFDYYDYDFHTEIRTIEKPVKFVIKGWTDISVYDDCKACYCNMESGNYSIREIINIEQLNNCVSLHVEGEINHKDFIGYIRYYDASIIIEEIDMRNRRNVFFNIKQIEGISGKDVYIAKIPQLTTREELFASIREQLRIRDTIITTWEQLLNLFSNIWWLGHSYYVIIHNDLSGLPKEDLEAYVEVFRQCQLRTLRVFFVIDELSRITVTTGDQLL